MIPRCRGGWRPPRPPLLGAAAMLDRWLASRSLVLALVLAAIAVCGLACGFGEGRPRLPAEAPLTRGAAEDDRPPTLAAVRHGDGLPPIADIVSNVRPAVVSIAVEVVTRDFFGRSVRSVQGGTGFFITEDGYIATNNHVVEGARRILVTVDDGREFDAEVIGTDAGTDLATDLAVIRIEAEADFTWLPFAAPDATREGEWVIAIGNSLGLRGGPTVTLGIVSATNRSITTPRAASPT